MSELAERLPLDLPADAAPPPEPLPAELVRLTDRLHDHGHVALGSLVIRQYLRLQELLRSCERLLELES